MSLTAPGGRQLLRWVATAACARLAFLTSACERAQSQPRAPHPPPRSAHAPRASAGDHPSRFVPQSVSKQGAVLDPDLVRGEASLRGIH